MYLCWVFTLHCTFGKEQGVLRVDTVKLQGDISIRGKTVVVVNVRNQQTELKVQERSDLSRNKTGWEIYSILDVQN